MECSGSGGGGAGTPNGTPSTPAPGGRPGSIAAPQKSCRVPAAAPGHHVRCPERDDPRATTSSGPPRAPASGPVPGRHRPPELRPPGGPAPTSERTYRNYLPRRDRCPEHPDFRHLRLGGKPVERPPPNCSATTGLARRASLPKTRPSTSPRPTPPGRTSHRRRGTPSPSWEKPRPKLKSPLPSTLLSPPTAGRRRVTTYSARRYACSIRWTAASRAASLSSGMSILVWLLSLYLES